jgi:hypothetical protein
MANIAVTEENKGRGTTGGRDMKKKEKENSI